MEQALDDHHDAAPPRATATPGAAPGGDEEELPNEEERRMFAFVLFEALCRAHLVDVSQLAVDYKFACEMLGMSIKSIRNIIGNNLVSQQIVTMKDPATGALLNYTPRHVTLESQKMEAQRRGMTAEQIKRAFGKSNGLASILGFDHCQTIHEWFHKFSTLMSVYLLRVLYVPIVEAVALSKTMAYWNQELRIPVSSFPKDGKVALSLKGGYLFKLFERGWTSLENGGSGLLDNQASSHPLWGVTVSRAGYFLKILGISRIIWYATPEETAVLRPLVRLLLMCVEEFSNAIFWLGCGTCSTANVLVCLQAEIDEAIRKGGCLHEDMNGITQEAIHAFMKQGLSHQAFGGLSGASGALVEVIARFLAAFSVTEGTTNMNCAKEKQRSERRRQLRLRKWLIASNGRIPVAGLIDSKPSDRPEPKAGSIWEGTEAWIGGICVPSPEVRQESVDDDDGSDNNDARDYLGVHGAEGRDDEDDEDDDETGGEGDGRGGSEDSSGPSLGGGGGGGAESKNDEADGESAGDDGGIDALYG